MKKYKFIAKIGTETLYPKGFYYQGKFIILVGCEIRNHTVRRKERIENVNIEISEDVEYNK